MFKSASKSQSKARVAIYGPSGSGKTYGSLGIAQGLADGGRIAVIDTEFGRASNYSDRFTFDIEKLSAATIDEYLRAINEAKAAGYPVLIIDSLTHAWHDLLELVDNGNGNKFNGWAKATPKQKELIRAIVSYPGHVIATIRAKTEWAVEPNEKGKMAPRRIGLAPEQGKGIEYEFDILLEINPDHVATVIKDNLTGTLQDKTFNKPGSELGAAIRKWLLDNVPIEAPKPEAAPAAPAEPAKPFTGPQSDALLMELELMIRFHRIESSVPKWLAHFGVKALADLSDAQISQVIERVKKQYQQQPMSAVA